MAQVIEATGHIEVGSRPATTILSKPPVFNIPRRNSSGSQIGAEMAHVVKTMPRPPAATVNDNNHWKRPGPCRQAQVTELLRFHPIAYSMIGFTGRPTENLTRTDRFLRLDFILFSCCH
jgi:hypothetical protein